MASATTVSSETRQAVRDAATPAPKPERAPKSPALKRPDGLSDSEWAIMRAAKNEDVHRRINEVMSDTGKPVMPEEAAVLMEIVSGAELAQLRTIKRLRESLAPKIKEAAAIANTLGDIKVRLFRIASQV